MEVAHPLGMPSGLGFATNTLVMDTTDKMDIDMDIDLGPLDADDMIEIEVNQSNTNAPHTEPNGANTSHQTLTDEEQIVPHKIHIRGLDDLTTEHVKKFAAEHFPASEPTRIEWIDDTSANIVYSTPAASMMALEQFTHPSAQVTPSAVQLRSAKEFSAHPASQLEVRLALITDQKRPRAHDISRFYLMHPEHDPREQRRRDRGKRDQASDYRRRRYGQDEHRRRRKDDRDQGFEPSMYDDDPDALANRIDFPASRRDSVSMRSSGSSEAAPVLGRGPRNGRRGNRSGMNGRDRSASPRREGDGGSGRLPRNNIRRRSPVGRDSSSSAKPKRELFPSKASPDSALNGSSKELFPNKQLAANLKKELFPTKAKVSHHRRSDAFDAADATADLFAKRLGISNKKPAPKNIDVEESSYGRLNSGSNTFSKTIVPTVTDDLNIRGASLQQDQGFKIRGLTADGTRIGVIKELFPGKSAGNAGKELFAEKLEGRGGRRNKAEDMFY